ncbi:MAG: agmatine deiminase family protein [Planctomycetota bacterium]
MRTATLVSVAGFSVAIMGTVATAGEPYPEGAAIPRSLTPAEAALIAETPIRVPAFARATAPPTGPIEAIAEYEAMEAIILAWEGPTSWKNILRDMAVAITTQGDADVWVYCDSSAEVSSVRSTLIGAGADGARVFTPVKSTDTIWIRDYGPQYIREGGVRAAVDHTYNRPRPNDNSTPLDYANERGHLYYDLPLVHGGGNYHNDLSGNGHATVLIEDENPSLTGQEIIDIWQDYWGLVTQLEDALPQSVDSTQHIDMWMQMCSDDHVVISDWPAQSGTIQDQVCDAAAVDFASRGFQVTRVPARTVSGTHYTYTNVVICNDAVLVPTYTSGTIVSAGYNPQALAAWQSVFPSKTIVDINCQAIVTAAGVMHCISKHVPANLNGETPTAYLRSPNDGTARTPGDMVEIAWSTDDDVAVTSVELELSLDNGQTWSAITSSTARDGSFLWTVPDVFSSEALVRANAFDVDGNSSVDESDIAFAINGTPPCVADVTTESTSNGIPDGIVTLSDFSYYLSLWAAGDSAADVTTESTSNGVPDGIVGLSDFSFYLSEWSLGCP